MIISASRRTDIPSFYGPWFMNRVRAGFCDVANPFNPKSISRLSLTPVDMEGIVFWTKDPGPFMASLDELDDYTNQYIFLYTLNHYPATVEPNIASLKERIDTFHELSQRIGSARVIWRYDPIILSTRLSVEYHIENFAHIAHSLQGMTQRVIISFVDYYGKTERRLHQLETDLHDTFDRHPLRNTKIKALTQALLTHAESNFMTIQSCAEDPALTTCGIQPGPCIDTNLWNHIFHTSIRNRKDPGQRPACLCSVSRDIGAHHSCLHGCKYCYATSQHARAAKNASRHDPNISVLIPSP